MSVLMNTQEYLSIIGKIKQEIKDAQYRAAVHVNADMLILYYDIGCVINEHKSWGNKFIDNLATDIKIAFPESKLPRIRQNATTARAPKIARGIRVFSASIASSAPKGQTAAMSRQPIAESVPLPVCRIRPRKTSRMNAKAQSMRRSRVRFIRLLQGPSLLGLQAGAR